MLLDKITFRAKITLLISSVIFALGVIAVLQARNDMRRVLGQELENRGSAIARDLAANLADPLLTDDLVGAYEMVNRTKLNNTDVRYVLVVNPTGEVRVNTFGFGIPGGLLEANPPPTGEDVRLRRIQTEEGLVRDVVAPVFAGRAGYVRVGMSDRHLETAVTGNTAALTWKAAAAVAIGMAFSYCLSYYLTRPLSELLGAVRSVTRGDLSRRVNLTATDEVGQLGTAFNTMARELETKEAARRHLMEQVIMSQEEERQRVARELHDELAQQVTSVILSLESVEAALPSDAQHPRDAVQRARRVAERSLAETRKLIWDLRPTVLDDLGLVPAIRSYAESHLRAVGTDVRLVATGVPAQLPPAMDTAIFRIVQEAVNNVAKHARASHVRIALSARDGVIRGEVVDNGTGFDAARLRTSEVLTGGGLGLRGMEERATILGGELKVDSNTGHGTRVTFAIPLS